MPHRGSAAVVLAVAALLAGCSQGEPKAAPELPARVCWGGAFAGSDVTPLLPAGGRAEFSPQADRALALAEERDTAICTLYIDGKMRFQASVTRWRSAESIDWTARASARPEPLDVGEKGILWKGGASSSFTCESARNRKSTGKHIELRISAEYAPDKRRLRTDLPELMKKLMAFARSELRCPGE
ncbi:hypothetical protein AB0M64_24085 [Streptomyces sp. NPDC051771]|uniref:hypothetical protein n=1 Tax=Streptomyces sp. NPDC051771 TaxID=3154847 RepID=UPI00342A20DC